MAFSTWELTKRSISLLLFVTLMDTFGHVFRLETMSLSSLVLMKTFTRRFEYWTRRYIASSKSCLRVKSHSSSPFITMNAPLVSSSSRMMFIVSSRFNFCGVRPSASFFLLLIRLYNGSLSSDVVSVDASCSRKLLSISSSIARSGSAATRAQ